MSSKLQLNLREWALLLLLAAVVAAVAYYYVLLAPLTAAKATARTELVQAEQQLRERREWQVDDAAIVASLESLTKERTLLQAELDTISHEQDVIDYVVALGLQTDSRVRSLEIADEQLKLQVFARTYTQVRLFLADMEQSPNLIPLLAAIVNDGQNGFSLNLEARIVCGQRVPGELLFYPRTVPFGR